MTSVLFDFASDGEANAFTAWLRSGAVASAVLEVAPSGVNWRTVSGATLSGPLDGGVGPVLVQYVAPLARDTPDGAPT